MATEMDVVRRVTQSIAYFVGGLALLLMAIAAFKGVMFSSSGGSRAGPPSGWYVIPIESATAQILLTALFSVGGFLLLWMAYRRSKQTDERRATKRRQKKIKN
jgi:membrane protein implicated in regulation of membrane protease activity